MRHINLRLTYLLTNRHSSRVVAFLQAVAAALDGMSRLFVSSVTLLSPIQTVELFGNIFAPSNSLEIWSVRIKILGKKFLGISMIVPVKSDTALKNGVDRPVSLFRKRYKIQP